MALREVYLKDLKPNPFRDMRVDPVDDAHVDGLVTSIDEHGYRSGGIVANTTLHIGAGHHRVAAGIKAGIKKAIIEIEEMTDADMVRWMARENATQRGQSPTSGPGSVIGALMVLVPIIMRGEVDKLPPQHGPSRGSARRSERDLEELQRKLTSENGIGEHIICDFLHDIPGFTERSIRDHLAVIKGTGAYARTVKEIASRIEKEQAEAEREAKRVADEAERERIAAEKAATAARERQRSANEAGERKRAKDAHIKATAAVKVATKKKQAAEKHAAKTPAAVARRTKEATTGHKVTLSERVASVFANKEQVRVFFQAAANIGTEALPIEKQLDLAKEIVRRAAEWPGRPRDLSGTFIREQITDILFNKSSQMEFYRASEEAAKEARNRDYVARAREMEHQLERDMQRFVLQGEKLLKMMDQHEDVGLRIKDRVVKNFRAARSVIDRFIQIAERQTIDSTLVKFPER